MSTSAILCCGCYTEVRGELDGFGSLMKESGPPVASVMQVGFLGQVKRKFN